MVCAACASRTDGKYNHCTCYLHGKHGINPAAGSMAALAWYNACDLSAKPTDTTNYLIAS